MSRKSKKKKKAKKKIIKKQQAVQLKKEPVLAEKAPEEIKEKIRNKAPKIKKLAKIKTAIKGKIKQKRSQIFESGNKTWKIIALFGTALLSLFIQYYVFNIFDPDMIKTNAAQIKTSAQEAYKISRYFDVIDTETTNPGYYLATGETDKDIFSFAVKATGDDPVVLKELVLTKTGDVPEGLIMNIRLFEGENAIAKAEIKKNKFIFKKITSILQPGVEKKYVVKTDVAKEGLSGSRFRLSLVNPADLVMHLDEEAVYSLDTFPFDGGYATIVGWRKK